MEGEENKTMAREEYLDLRIEKGKRVKMVHNESERIVKVTSYA